MEHEIRLIQAVPENAGELTAICIRAFNSDNELPGCPFSGPGGPPGYDSSAWHAGMMKRSCYYCLSLDDKIVGGIIIFRQKPGTMLLGQIYLDPDYHGRGLGMKAVRAVLDKFPETKHWRLETPVWNIRTRKFYAKCGFSETEMEGDSVWFEKKAT